MRFRTLWLGLLLSCWVTLAHAPPQFSPPTWPSTVFLARASWSPMLQAIYAVESDDGKDCSEGDDGELSCFQILPATARLEGCPVLWRFFDAFAAACGQRWLDRGQRTCRRWDVYAPGRWYNGGTCMPRKARPRAYEMNVNYKRLRYLM